MGQSVRTAYQMAQVLAGKRVEVRPLSWVILNGYKYVEGIEPAAYHEPTDTFFVTKKLFDELKEMKDERSINTSV